MRISDPGTAKPIYGERVRQVRKLRRLTQKALAAEIGLQQNTVSQIEAGLLQPSEGSIDALSRVVRFPASFFRSEPGPDFPLGSLVFRARRSATKLDLEEAHVWAELVYECALKMAIQLKVPPASLPNLSGESPVRSAQIARSFLGLSPDRPVPHVVNGLEQQGILVLALPVQLPGRDAFSAWAGINPRYPVVVLPPGSPGGRQRFTVAHELDHLLTPDYRGYSKLAEDNADRFASEFLMPEAGIRDELPAPMTLSRLTPLARRWGVSLQALIRRAADLGTISQRRAQQLYVDLSSQGFSHMEPPAAMIRVERPRGFRRMAEKIYGEEVDAEKMAADFNLPGDLTKSMICAHATRFEMVTTAGS